MYLKLNEAAAAAISASVINNMDDALSDVFAKSEYKEFIIDFISWFNHQIDLVTLTNDGGELLINITASEIHQMDDNLTRDHALEFDMEDIFNDYLDNCDGSWSSKDVRSNANILREFSKQLDQRADELEKDGF